MKKTDRCSLPAYRLTKIIPLAIFIVMLALTTMSCQEDKNTANWVKDPASYVNPFIGTEGERGYRTAANTVPGAVMPFGMFNFGPEHAFNEKMVAEGRSKAVKEKGARMPVSPGGYNYASTRLKGFSLTRLSGTGCVGASGDIPFLPFTEEIKHSPDNDPMDRYYSTTFSHDNETSRPGYYQVGLGNGVDVELASTARSGIARFKYPEDKPALLLVRSSYSQLGSSDAFTSADLEKGEISGYVVSGNFCGYLGEYNRRDYYKLHFFARLDTPILETGGWENDQIIPGATETEGGMGYGKNGIPGSGEGSGLWLKLDTSENQTVTMRVGISYVSIENARENLEKEQQPQETLEAISQRCYKAWNDALGRIRVESEDKGKLTTFYTALYHSLFHPNVFSDVNGQYAGFDGQIHQVEKTQSMQFANFSGWDVYRSQLQLVSMLFPEVGSDIAQSLFNQARQHNGIWDRWTHNSGPTGVMSGDPSTIAIANFVAFGADNFDVAGAYKSLAKAAKVPTEFDLSPVGKPVFSRGQKPSLDQWLELGYISDDNNAWEGASETLEQSSAFFALSQLAKRLGHEEDHELFLAQSGNWKNLYNPKATPEAGFIQGRNKDGSWKEPFDPHNGGLFVEGSPLQYLWMVPFDGEGLFELMGGGDVASKRLDAFFRKPDGSWALYRAGGAFSDVSNQPSINAPWMYLFAGKAWKSQEVLRATMNILWKPETTGIPGQDDLGQMSSWYVFSAMGMYPLYPGRADMVLGSPLFNKVEIVRENSNILIETIDNSNENIYVKSLKVNGKKSLKSWLSEAFMNKGGKLTFTMSPEPNKDFGANGNKPPSFSK